MWSWAPKCWSERSLTQNLECAIEWLSLYTFLIESFFSVFSEGQLEMANRARKRKFHRQNPLELETPNLEWSSGSNEVLKTIFCSQTSVWRAVELAKTILVLRPPNAWESIALLTAKLRAILASLLPFFMLRYHPGLESPQGIS
jgi:hypothetical protein